MFLILHLKFRISFAIPIVYDISWIGISRISHCDELHSCHSWHKLYECLKIWLLFYSLLIFNTVLNCSHSMVYFPVLVYYIVHVWLFCLLSCESICVIYLQLLLRRSFYFHLFLCLELILYIYIFGNIYLVLKFCVIAWGQIPLSLGFCVMFGSVLTEKMGLLYFQKYMFLCFYC